MKLFKRNLKKHGFFICVFFTLLAALILRTYNFSNRITMGSDSGRDIMVGQIALQRHELPMIGSFSSAGPFVFGPLYYWFVMIALFLSPFSFRGPWILMSMIGFFTVGIMMITGYRIGGKKLSIVLGLFTAFCPQFVSRSTGLSQHSLVGFATALLILFFVLFYQTKKLRYAFFMGISIGVALSMHYQALNLLIFLPAILFIPKTKKSIKIIGLILLLVGFIIPSLPIIYWDSHQGFANTRNIMDYMLIGQYRIYVPNSWKIYLFQFLPDYWSNVVGGNKPIAGILMLTTLIVFSISFFKRKIKGEIAILGSILGILLLVIRYYRGERFEGYMIYIAPFIFLLTSWALVTLYTYTTHLLSIRKSTIIGIIVLAVILLADFKNASQFIFVEDVHQKEVLTIKAALLASYPNEKFHIYDYRWFSTDTSHALVVFLQNDQKLSDSGISIGVKTINSCSQEKPIYKSQSIELVYLGKNPNNKFLTAEGYIPVNSNDVYDDLITRWTKKQKLKTNFSLIAFIRNIFPHH